MKINYCVPTRGKESYLKEFLPGVLAKARLPDTRIVIGFDEDRAFEAEPWRGIDRVICSIKPREDSLGLKYNRCAAAYPADLYVMSADDIGISTDGWDIVLDAQLALVPDRFASFTFGIEPNGEYLPSMFGISREMVEASGFFAPPYFPFWWHNTWVWEVAEMAGRLIPAGIETFYPEALPPSPRRDMAFWAKIFDSLRGDRREAALRIIAKSDDQPWRKMLLISRLQKLMEVQAQRNSLVRNPTFEAILNASGTNIPEELEPRHIRLREAVEGIA